MRERGALAEAETAKMEGIGKWFPFCQKWYINGLGVGPRGGASPYKTLLTNHLRWGAI